MKTKILIYSILGSIGWIYEVFRVLSETGIIYYWFAEGLGGGSFHVCKAGRLK